MSTLTILAFTHSNICEKELMPLLENKGQQTVFVNNFASLSEYLQNESHEVAAIILDIPDDTVQFDKELRSLKNKESIKYIPFIGLVSDETKFNTINRQFYFHVLMNNHHNDMLLHTLEAAINDYKRYKSFLSEVNSRTSAIGLIKSGQFNLQTLKQAEALTTMLSLACPDPTAVALGLSELLVNAIEHGNLEITFQQKTHLLENGLWDQEIGHRLKLEQYKNRIVDVEFKRYDSTIEITITDEGKGFNWRNFVESNPLEQSMEKHGRGIALAVAMGFKEVRYNEKGNQVTAVIDL